MSDPVDVNVNVSRLRPTFTLELPLPADEAVLRIREGIDRQELRESTMAAGHYAEFLVDEADRRVWSPRLSVRIEEAPSGSTLRGRFSPRPDVWTGFMFLYFLVVFGICFGATLGYVQQASDETAWGYWVVPVGLLTITGIHLAGYVGQRLGSDQMRELRGRLDAVLSRQFENDGATDRKGPRAE